MTDWSKITQVPAIQGLAEAIRRRLNVTVGVLTSQGVVCALGERQSVSKSVCEAFGRGQGACAATYGAWFDAVKNAQMPIVQTCHAGLSAVVVPIFVDATCVAAVFASGFLRASQSNAATVFERSRALGVNAVNLSAALAQEQALSDREVAMLTDLLLVMAQSIQTNFDATDVAHSDVFDAFVGSSEPILHVKQRLECAAASLLPVCFVGDVGSGKSLCAELVHRASVRKQGPYLTISCVAPAETQFASELFGHKRGAIPGALCDMSGLLDLSNDGSIVLEDIDQLTLPLQKQILRLIETQEYCALGDAIPKHTNVRILATSRTDLAQAVDDGLFDRALFDRLNVLSIWMPNLNEIVDDIEAIANDYLAANGQKLMLDQDVWEVFKNYDWPGNVRELQAELDRIVVLQHVQRENTMACVSARIVQAAQKTYCAENAASTSSDVEFISLAQWLDDVEKSMIVRILQQNHYNRTKTAEVLGISRRNLIRKIERFNLDTPDND